MNAITLPHRPPPSPWRSVLPPLAVLLLLVLFAYRDTAASMVAIWARSDTFAHAFLVPPISAWLIWRQRDRLAAAVPHPSAAFLLFTVGAGIVWLLGDLGAANSVTQLAFVALLVLAVLGLVGPVAARTMLFPLGFLFFAVPIGEFAMPQLMMWTADFTALAVRASGIPVYRVGLDLVIPSGTWHIVEGCSGVRYLMASAMVGTLFAYLNFHSLRRRLIFVGISLLVPIVANWLRAYFIVVLGHVSNNRLAIGIDHLVYGWIFFGVVLLVMFGIGARFSEAPPPAGVGAAAEPASTDRAPRIGRTWAIAAAGAVLALAPQLALRALDARDDTVAAPLTLPATLNDGWQRSAVQTSEWKPHFEHPSVQLDTTYASQDRQVGLFIGYYRNQNAGRKLVSSDNGLVAANDLRWRPISDSTEVVMVGDMPITLRAVAFREETAPSPTDNGVLAWQIYWINGRLTASDSWARIYGAIDRLRGRGDDSAVIVAYARRDAASGPKAALESFLQANFRVILSQLSAVRDRGRE